MSILTPLSNDPVSMAEYAQKLGLSPTCFECSEIYSFDPEVLQFVPPNARAVIFLFPIGESSGFLETRHMNDGPVEGTAPWFSIQTLGNACGTIAVLHTIFNSLDQFDVVEGSWLHEFIAKSMDMSPQERARFIEFDNSVKRIHENAAMDDSTPIIEEDMNNHFIAFVPFEGKVWELDGRKPQPICHGPYSDFLVQATDVIQREFIPHVDDIMRTSMIAFCSTK